MGRPKPLLRWGERTLIEYQLAQLAAAPVDETIVVLGHRAEEVLPHVEGRGATTIFNRRYQEGRASSLRLAAAVLPDTTEAVVVLAVDQPRPAEVTRTLVEEHRGRGMLITVPTHAGRRGHPTVISGRLLPELRELSEEDLGLRAVIRRHDAQVAEVPFDDGVVLLDINDPAEYERAKESYFRR